MPPETTKPSMDAETFDTLVARAGIPLTSAQKAGLHAVWGGVEAWQKLVRNPAPPAEAEPSTTFSAEAGR